MAILRSSGNFYQWISFQFMLAQLFRKDLSLIPICYFEIVVAGIALVIVMLET